MLVLCPLLRTCSWGLASSEGGWGLELEMSGQSSERPSQARLPPLSGWSLLWTFMVV